jgi:hypothetical protein
VEVEEVEVEAEAEGQLETGGSEESNEQIQMRCWSKERPAK